MENINTRMISLDHFLQHKHTTHIYNTTQTIMHSLLLPFAALALGCFVSAAPITAVNSTLVARYDHCNRAGVFALTFDDGPSQYSYDLAKSLHQQGIKATFFINGNNTV